MPIFFYVFKLQTIYFTDVNELIKYIKTVVILEKV